MAGEGLKEERLKWFHVNEAMIKSKDIPAERSHAMAFAAGLEVGREIGKCIIKTKIAELFLPEKGMNEWA